MNKADFLAALRKGLAGLPEEEIEERLTFYSEMIDDRVEEGLSEEEAVARIGPVELVVSQILSDLSDPPPTREGTGPRRRFSAWELVLLILGSPLWLSLAAVIGVAVFTLYVVIWSVLISFWALDLALAACAIAGVLSPIGFALQGSIWPGVALFGAGLACAGACLLFFFACKRASKGTLSLAKRLFTGLKSRLIRKERRA